MEPHSASGCLSLTILSCVHCGPGKYFRQTQKSQKKKIKVKTQQLNSRVLWTINAHASQASATDIVNSNNEHFFHFLCVSWIYQMRSIPLFSISCMSSARQRICSCPGFSASPRSKASLAFHRGSGCTTCTYTVKWFEISGWDQRLCLSIHLCSQLNASGRTAWSFQLSICISRSKQPPYLVPKSLVQTLVAHVTK